MFIEIAISSDNYRNANKRKPVLGVGINDAPYFIKTTKGGQSYTCPFYLRWMQMLTRCYSKVWVTNNPTYQGCSVVPEWHSFMEFKAWMRKHDWQGKHLDKDLKVHGNKVYGPDTCLWVSAAINSLFNTGNKNASGLPTGVSFNKGHYEVGISYGGGKRVYVGSYPTVEKAFDGYLEAKQEAIDMAANNEPDPVIREAVLRYASVFTDTLKVLNTIA